MKRSTGYHDFNVFEEITLTNGNKKYLIHSRNVTYGKALAIVHKLKRKGVNALIKHSGDV